MPKLEPLPCLEDREENDDAEAVPPPTLRDFQSPNIINWRQDSMRTLHVPETEVHQLDSISERVLNGNELFDQVYGAGALAFQNLEGGGFALVTSVTRYHSSSLNGTAGSEPPEGQCTSPQHNPGSVFGGGRRRAYSMNSSDAVVSMSACNTAGKHMARETAYRWSTMLLGTARFMPPQPPPMGAAAAAQPVLPVPAMGVGPLQLPGRLSSRLQRIRRSSRQRESWAQNVAEEDEDDVFEEEEEEWGEGEVVLPPPAQPVLEPAIRVQLGMHRRCSI